MTEQYKKNLEALEKYLVTVEDYKELLDSIKEIGKEIVVEDKIKYFRYEEKYYQLNSVDIEHEIQIYVKNVNFKRDSIIIVVGMANKELIDYLIQKTTKETRIVVLEPNIYVMKYMLINYDFSEDINSGKFAFVFGELEHVQRFWVSVSGFGWESMAYNMSVLSCPNYYIYQDYIGIAVKKLTEMFQSNILKFGNSLEDMIDGFRCNYKNISQLVASNDIAEIIDKYKGYPAIVVASGPSLDKNVEYLKEAQDKALIIACDASYQTCKNHGVKPDAIASIERGIETYKYYYENKEFEDDLVFVGPNLVWPDILKNFKGKKILMGRQNAGAENWLRGFFPQFRFVDIGMSCANVAFKVAQLAGCNPIILIGQDLAYTDDKIHSDSTHTKYEGKNEDKTSDIWVKDIYGENVRTCFIYNMFREWFEIEIIKDKNVTVVDATEGGALIEGSTVMKLKEAIDKYCDKDIKYHMEKYLKDISVTDKKRLEIYNKIEKDVKKQVRSLELIVNRTKKQCNSLTKIREKNYENPTRQQLIEIVEQLKKGSSIIPYLKNNHINNYAYFQHTIRQIALKIKSIDNELNKDNVMKNIEYQLKTMHLIMQTANVLIKEYDNTNSFIENIVKELEGVIEHAG